MLSKEQRAHELAMMITKSFTDTSMELAKSDAEDAGTTKMNIDENTSLDLYLATYQSALAKLNLD
ncbi:unnamed protein product [Fructobacillus fructosus]|uniref:hypothetical protein n=1 Tax=Fructobacillus fructosus TaxID=1631 RepID=UPI000219574E|nr:hypothetical protein [Fructobacillus fructosus]KRN53315.1 hypothetical protein IV71_GL000106 [Fructobacillus fructosus KCTC 3544]CAK1225675.1 unnamed protein product [Fructobacillus fructosus]CAK1225719.1 unnamed protein product [Fructobacillus fructosus]CAK1231377.1 unnamed protein product [Fructobacillus fructosus]CAK1233305.1 unnamed protein product [Fructobacillus fructosus]